MKFLCLGHEQIAPPEARPNPLHAVRGIVHAVDLSRCGREPEHGFQAA